MRKIVVGFDGSEHGRGALERAAAIASEGADLYVVSAAKISPSLMRDPAGGAAAIDPVEEEARAAALEEARTILADKGVTSVHLVEGRGNPADILVQHAADVGADLIVVGSRGHGLVGRLLLGSVSTNVVHHAECDVLVVR